MGVDERRVARSFFSEGVSADVYGLGSVKYGDLSFKGFLESFVAALDALEDRNETCFALFLPPFGWTGVSLCGDPSIGGSTILPRFGVGELGCA